MHSHRINANIGPKPRQNRRTGTVAITLKQLETFVRVADLGSFRRAAERLATTQPNISARIAALEGELGQRLLERDAGSVTLTQPGRVALAHARRVLRGVEELMSATGGATRVQGVLRLGVTEMIAHTWLRHLLKALPRAYPNVLLELTVDRSQHLSTALFDRSLDLALQSGPFERRSTGAIALGRYPFIWVASPALGLDAGTDLSLGDIARFAILTHARGTFPYDQLTAHVARSGRGDVRLVTSSNLAACIQMALDGLGVACLPRAMVAGDLAAGRLIGLRYPWVPDALDFAARFDAERAPGHVAGAAALARAEARAFAERQGS